MSAPMVVVADLARSYGSGRTRVDALRGVSFSLERGAFVTVVGRSGSGKTTLLGCVGGLDAPTSGTVEVDGVRIDRMTAAERSAARRSTIAFVFQSFGLLPTLSAAENVGLPLRLVRTPVADRRDRVAELLDAVGLADRASVPAAKLSGGQQQRIAIARALAVRPSLLIADEPTGQLDAATGGAVLDLLRRVVAAEGATALVSTHDPAVAAAGDRTLHLEDGRLVPS